MLLDKNFVILRRKNSLYPLNIFTTDGRMITEYDKNNYFYDDNFLIEENGPVVLINPTASQLLKTCVYLKSKVWIGKVYLLFDKQLLHPFYNVNDI
ncbi:core protein [Pteropox virus]|uniref:Core protein n=1 Tax=Pteropox virus TaxID=1873698 RepID=A0A1B1MRI3_9POXV|nr:core protein [Pteropox virus]ANS71194.1 core protein [Pteropox virus]